MITIFGSINVDVIYEMPVMPVSGQTLLARAFRIEPGGKGANQAVGAARDGARVTMVGAVGQDSVAQTALATMAGAGVDLSALARVDAPTGCASIFIDAAGHNLIAVGAGANMQARAAQVSDDLLAASDIVVMQMETDPAEIAELACRARMAGKYTILNLAPAIRVSTGILSLFDLLVLNEDEAAALAGWIGSAADARALSLSLGVDILCTLGGRGAEAFARGRSIRVPALAVEIVDTSAAGDCFIGVLASALDGGAPLEEAMRRASTAAGLACARRGSQNSIPLAAETSARLAAEGGRVMAGVAGGMPGR